MLSEEINQQALIIEENGLFNIDEDWKGTRCLRHTIKKETLLYFMNF